MKPISRLVVSLAVLVGVNCGTTANAQIEAPTSFKTDADPKLQSRASILEAFDVDTSKLPEGTSVNRVRAADGSIDELRLSVPAKITVNWQAPTRQTATCDIKLTMVRTGAQRGANGQPPNSQHVFSSGVINHWAGAFWMPIRNGKIAASNPVEWPDEGYPTQFAGDVVMVPGPNCDLVSEIGFTITQNDPPYIEQRKQMIEQEVPEAQITAALEMMLEVGGMSANPFGKTVPYDQYMRTACHSGGFPVLRVDDGNPETFLMTFEGRHEDEDRTECPLIAAKGYIHVGEVSDSDPFELLRSLPEPKELRYGDGVRLSCTNNDPVNPLVRFEFSTDVDPDSLDGHAYLEILKPDGEFESMDARFEVLDDTNIVLDPAMSLEPLRTYRVTLFGGKNGIRGLEDDDYLPDDVEIEFETAAGTDSDSFRAMLGKEIDTGIYQVVRDAKLTPGKKTYARALVSYPAADYKGRADELNEDACLNVEVRSSDNGPQVDFASRVFNYKREDLVTKDDRRKGRDKALLPGWTPSTSDRFGFGRQFETRITPFNFTSAIEGKETPEVIVQKDKTIDILPNEIWLPIKVYSGIINMNFDEAIYDQILTRNILGPLGGTTMRELYQRGNEKSPELARYILQERGRISRTLADYLPANGASFGMSPNPVEIDIDMFFPKSWLKEGDGDVAALASAAFGFHKYHTSLAKFIQEQAAYTLQRKVMRNCRGLEVCVLTVPFQMGGAQAKADARQLSRGLIIGIDTLANQKHRNKLGLAFTHEIGHTFGLAHAPNDFNSRDEQNRVYKIMQNQRIRWPGIDAIRRADAGGMAYFSSEHGNSQDFSLWPTMYMSLVNTKESAMPTDQYEQAIKAMVSPLSGEQRFFGPFQTGAFSSNAALEAFDWRASNSTYEPGTEGPQSIPQFAFAVETPGSDEAEDGVIVSALVAMREDGSIGGPFPPSVDRAEVTSVDPMSSFAGETQTFILSVLDGDGNELATTSLDIPAFDLSADFTAARLTGFLPLSADQQDAVRLARFALTNGDLIVERELDSLALAPTASDVETELVSPSESEGDDEFFEVVEVAAATPPIRSAQRPTRSTEPPPPAAPKAPKAPPLAPPASSGAVIGSCGMSQAEVKRLVDHQMSGLEGMSGIGNVDQLKAELLASYLAPDYPKENLCEMRKELPAE